jgi:low affinity Fe/Cu permease
MAGAKAMNNADIREVVLQVLREERNHYNEKLDETVLKTVSAILTGFGIEDDERKEIKADFRYLRRFRNSAESVHRVGIATMVTVLITGVLGAIWLAVKTLIGK